MFIILIIIINGYSITSHNTLKKNEYIQIFFYPTLIFEKSNILFVGGNGPNNYSIIQEAINDASDDDKIFVYNGIYYENLIINKKIILIGENKEQTIVDGSGMGNSLKVNSNNVQISNFSFKNGGIGIYILSSSNVSIKNNNVFDNWGGIGILRSSQCVIKNNRIFSNLFEGINPIESEYIYIKENIIENNLQGIFLSETNDSKINKNTIKGNIRGIEIRSGSNRNLIYHNNFKNNQEDHAFDESVNSWDNDYPIGGNYWDDYVGNDGNSDGIGDSSYSIEGGNNEDRYPFIDENGWNVPPILPYDPYPENRAENISINVNLSWNCSDPDNDPLTYDVYFKKNDQNPNVLISNNQSEKSIFVGGLDYNTSYYWKIVAWDNNSASKEGLVWVFTTIEESNINPEAFIDSITPNPANYSEEVYFEGHGEDKDGSIQAYYWESSIDGPLSTYLSFNRSSLSIGSHFIYFKVQDDDGSWSNLVSEILIINDSEENNPPLTPSITGEINGKIGIGYEYCLDNVIDIDNDTLFVYWDWGDGTFDGYIGPYLSGDEICAIHTWEEEGIYIIKAKLRDAYGLESDWAYLSVSMPKSKEILDWPMTYGLLFGKIENPYIEKKNEVSYLNFYASNVNYFYLTYGFGGLNFFFFDKLPEKNCRMSLGIKGSFYGFYNVDSIFGRYNGYYP
jgi:parallel beta-helix repeat protein